VIDILMTIIEKFVRQTLSEISNEPFHHGEENPDDEFGMDIGLPETFDNLLRQMKRASRENKVTREKLDSFIAALEKLTARHNLIH